VFLGSFLQAKPGLSLDEDPLPDSDIPGYPCRDPGNRLFLMFFLGVGAILFFYF